MAEQKTIYESAETLYQKAVKKMNDEPLIVQYAYKIDNFNLAADMFEECGDYLDAPALAQLCREKAEQAKKDGMAHTYERAVDELNKQDLPKEMWPKVRDAFAGLGDYKDAKELTAQAQKKVDYYEKKSRRVRTAVFSALGAVVVLTGVGLATGYFRYLEGYGFMKAGMYEQAVEIFEKRPGFLKADEYAVKAKELHLIQAEVGDNVMYGAYDWKLIGRDEETATLIAANLGEKSAFYSAAFNDKGGDTSWADSSLRAWLNGEIYEEGFTEEEKAHMVLQTTPASENTQAGTAYTEETQDYLTLLTAEQTEEYADMLKSLSLDYWLATPGSSMDRAAYISGGRHQVMADGYTADSALLAVRPIIKVDCSGLED